MPRLRVWHIPQVPMKAFYIEVRTLREAKLVLDALAGYDEFQFQNRIKPDYCNAAGLCEFDPTDTEDSPEGSWVTWYDPETGAEIDDLTDEQIETIDLKNQGGNE